MASSDSEFPIYVSAWAAPPVANPAFVKLYKNQFPRRNFQGYVRCRDVVPMIIPTKLVDFVAPALTGGEFFQALVSKKAYPMTRFRKC